MKQIFQALLLFFGDAFIYFRVNQLRNTRPMTYLLQRCAVCEMKKISSPRLVYVLSKTN